MGPGDPATKESICAVSDVERTKRVRVSPGGMRNSIMGWRAGSEEGTEVPFTRDFSTRPFATTNHSSRTMRA